MRNSLAKNDTEFVRGIIELSIPFRTRNSRYGLSKLAIEETFTDESEQGIPPDAAEYRAFRTPFSSPQSLLVGYLAMRAAPVNSSFASEKG
jgi:hypothetical protein